MEGENVPGKIPERRKVERGPDAEAVAARAGGIRRQIEGARFSPERIEELARELAEREYKLEQNAMRDQLTGAWNRGFMRAELFREVGSPEREKGMPLGVAMLDLDYFKKVNDIFGHLSGDEVLKIFVRTMGEWAKKYRLTGGRWGGEEFLVLAPGLGAAELAGVLNDLGVTVREQLAAQSGLDPEKIKELTISAGIAGYEFGDEPDVLLDRADKLMYQAKGEEGDPEGRNRMMVQGERAPRKYTR
jgi:diguanylate cyclase (GGDEF)-like protein